jgi:hypothetical protein
VKRFVFFILGLISMMGIFCFTMTIEPKAGVMIGFVVVPGIVMIFYRTLKWGAYSNEEADGVLGGAG